MVGSSYNGYDLKYDPEAQRMLERRRQQELAASGQQASLATSQAIQSAATPPTPANPSLVQTASSAVKPPEAPVSPSPKKRKRGRPANVAADVQVRQIPRELWNAMRMALPFPELTTLFGLPDRFCAVPTGSKRQIPNIRTTSAY